MDHPSCFLNWNGRCHWKKTPAGNHIGVSVDKLLAFLDKRDPKDAETSGEPSLKDAAASKDAETPGEPSLKDAATSANEVPVDDAQEEEASASLGDEAEPSFQVGDKVQVTVTKFKAELNNYRATVVKV